MSQHSADASLLGYYFQGMYALVKLLDANDYDRISIETFDDVYLDGDVKTLYQLKHSLNSGGNLNEKNDGLWKTIRIWAKMVEKEEVDEATFFIFVTPLLIDENCSLTELSKNDSNRSRVVDDLLMEAKRVAGKRKIAKSKQEALPYKTRWPGCEAYLSLCPEQRVDLVNKITIHPNNFNIKDIHNEVTLKIKNTVPLGIRPKLVERLIEWWDRRVVLGLLNEASRDISKHELIQYIVTLVNELSEENLTDDYGDRNEEADILGELGGNMEAQIDLVNGGKSRKKRAAVARWQARNQRERWLDDDLINGIELKKLDKRLINVWDDYFQTMKYDLEDEDENVLAENGRSLLDWSHRKAFQEVIPVREGWRQPYLVQGSYQQLAEDLVVGWHPEFDEILKKNSSNQEGEK
ncbi:ABC-three component system protein [Pseudalkalibacillus hwajinpoensis]|uniref:ABC-three component system protein n=1 Tax=Guptibacillus hwajinpoensis TaxID=208199 RepID=UPI00325B6159